MPAGRSAPLASLRSTSLTTHPPRRGVRVVSDRGTDRPAGRGRRDGKRAGSGRAGEGPETVLAALNECEGRKASSREEHLDDVAEGERDEGVEQLSGSQIASSSLRG